MTMGLHPILQRTFYNFVPFLVKSSPRSVFQTLTRDVHLVSDFVLFRTVSFISPWTKVQEEPVPWGGVLSRSCRVGPSHYPLLKRSVVLPYEDDVKTDYNRTKKNQWYDRTTFDGASHHLGNLHFKYTPVTRCREIRETRTFLVPLTSDTMQKHSVWGNQEWSDLRTRDVLRSQKGQGFTLGDGSLGYVSVRSLYHRIQPKRNQILNNYLLYFKSNFV